MSNSTFTTIFKQTQNHKNIHLPFLEQKASLEVATFRFESSGVAMVGQNRVLGTLETLFENSNTIWVQMSQKRV